MPEDRHCICDENVQCTECSLNGQQCPQHDGLYCSSCNDWYHAKCVGGTILDAEGVKTLSIKLSNNKSLQITLHGPSQDADPWYCFRCWENIKFVKNQTNLPKPFDAVSNAEQALRLGIDPNVKKCKPSDWKKWSTDYVTELPSAIGDFDIAHSILSNTPRAFPTPKPMDEDARYNLKCAGRRFEISQLCLNIKSCDCCGATKPADSDPWGGKCAITGQSAAGKHLRRGFFQAHK